MADTYIKYKNVPVSALELSKIKKFLESNLPYLSLLQPGLLPAGANVPDMIQQCKAAIEELLSKYQKYKELGYVKDESQLMALGQLTNNSKTITNFLIARSWKGMPEAEKVNRLTKSKFVELLNSWFNFHKDRIGWTSVSAKPILLKDPNNPNKSIKYYLSDNYHKPINQAYYPHDLRRNPYLSKIGLSVAQSERILTGIVERFTNDNDMVYFSPDNPDEANAFTVIKELMKLPTEKSKTAKGAQFAFKKAIYDISEARRIRKLNLQKKAKENMTVSELEAEIQNKENNHAELVKEIDRLQDIQRQTLIDKEKLKPLIETSLDNAIVK